MLTSQLDYDLPAHLIATTPVQPRDAARLMIIDRRTGQVDHRHVRDLPNLVGCDGLNPGDLMVFNQSRVLPASFTARRIATGGTVRGLYLASSVDTDDCHWQVMLESGGKLRQGEVVRLDERAEIQLTEHLGNGVWKAKLDSTDDTTTLLYRIGRPPLPPYIRRQRRQLGQPELQCEDQQQYNTVFASDPGSVAAPTAGMHFTRPLLDQLSQAGIQQAVVTLHIGLGTFAPVRTMRIEDHPIHSEWVSVPAATIRALRNGGRIIPVGTTTVRALESLSNPPPASGDFTTLTRLFITPSMDQIGDEDNSCSVGGPGFTFRYTDALMTNFHLPRSTLLAMVAALPGVGVKRLMGWYQLAIDQGYRFYSYGDAMLIL